MIKLLYLLVLPALLFVGCMDNSSNLNSPDIQINQQSNSPNWIKLPADLGQGFGVETEYSASKLIKRNKGGEIKLKVKIHQHGSEYGDHFEFKAKVKIEKHSFTEVEKLFTITMDPESAGLIITPSPDKLDKHVTIDLEIKGIDVSQIDLNTFDFFFIGDNNVLLETSKKELKVVYNKHKIKVKKAVIYPTTIEETPPGARYAFLR